MSKKNKLVLLICGLIIFTAPQVLAATTIDPNINANDIVRQMGIGWNLGNTLDAHSSGNPGAAANLNNLDAAETLWLGNTANRTTEGLIDAIIDAGFNTIRIPVTWYKAVTDAPSFESGEYIIDERWMNRVQSIVDMAYNRGMFVILNTHHDEVIIRLGNANNEEGLAERARGSAAVAALWTQIAEHFKDYGERLIFEGLNEPRHRSVWPDNPEWATLTPQQRNNTWDWNGSAFAMESVNQHNQTFVDIVRGTGGNNRYRLLMAPTYAAGAAGWGGSNGWGHQLTAFRLPTDIPENVINKLILSVHIYSPHSWAHDGLLSPNNPINPEVPSYNETRLSQIETDLNRVSNRAAFLGVPVILGEWGTVRRHHLSDRIDHAYDYVRIASEMEDRPTNPVIMRTVVWDDHGNFLLINRQNLPQPHVNDNAREIINAMIAGRGDLRAILYRRIRYAEARVAETNPSTDGTDVPRNRYWAIQAQIDAMNNAIQDAWDVYNNN